jgi:hypothetical protein
MNRYLMIRRLRGPLILLLVGVVALLHKAGVLAHPWGYFWALVLILIGVLMLAERAALHGGEFAQTAPPPAAYPPPSPAAQPEPVIIPAEPKTLEGGQQ